MKRVFRAASLWQVAHARNVLIMAGIDSEMRNQYLAGALGDLPMFETWPQLWVEDALEQLPCGRSRWLRKHRAANHGSVRSAVSSWSHNSPPAGDAGRHHRLHSTCQHVRVRA